MVVKYTFFVFLELWIEHCNSTIPSKRITYSITLELFEYVFIMHTLFLFIMFIFNNNKLYFICYYLLFQEKMFNMNR